MLDVVPEMASIYDSSFTLPDGKFGIYFIIGNAVDAE